MKQPQQKNIQKISEASLVTIEITLCKSFTEFLKEYLQFFGDQKSLEEICRKMIYSETKQLYRNLEEFIKQNPTYLNETSLFNKNWHLAIVSTTNDETQENPNN